jgi:PAS domain S-box-containing protein
MDPTPPPSRGASTPEGAPSGHDAPSARPTLVGHGAALLAVGLIVALFLHSTQRLTSSSRALVHSLDLLNEMDHLLYLVREVETSQRGVLFLQQAPDNASYAQARQRIDVSLARLGELAPEQPVQRERVERLQQLVRRELVVLERNLALTRAGQPEVALATLREGDSERLLRELRELEERIDADERSRLANQDEQFVRHARGANVIVLSGSLCLLSFIGLSSLSVRRERQGWDRQRRAQVAAEGERQRERYQRVLSQLPAAVGVYRAPDQRCELANPALERLRGGGERMGPTASDPLLVALDTVFQTGQPASGVALRLPPSPAPEGPPPPEAFVNYTLLPLMGPEERVEEVLLFALEVTDEVRARRAEQEALAHRQRAEVALRENEALLRRTLRASDVGVWEADMRTRRVVWSSHAEAMSGVAPNSFPGTFDAFLALLHPEDRPQMASRLRGPLTLGDEFRLEYRILRADGGLRWHENRGRVLPDEQGQPTRLAGVLLDITSRKLAERLQRESEERFRLLTETLPQLIWMARPDGAAEYFNRRWFEYTGQTLEQARGAGWQRVLHPDDLASARALLEHSLATGTPHAFEARVRRASDSAWHWFLIQGLALRDGEGPITHWFGSCTDIDEQKQGTASLRFLAEVSAAVATSLERTPIIQQLAHLAVPTLADWCVVDALDEADRFERVAVAHADPSRADIADVLRRHAPTDRPDHPPLQAAKLDRTVVMTDITPAFLERISRGEEHQRALESLNVRSLVSVPLLARGHILGVMTCFTTPVSGRRYERGDVLRLEEVARRAAMALDNARLFALARQERERAEEANRLKDEFLATVSHELRTPLTAMIGWLKLLRDGRLPPAKHARALETVDRNAHAQAQLIEDLLDVSRIISGKLRLETQPVHLMDVVRAALESVRPAAEAKGMHLHTEHSGGDDRVMGDAGRLQQVVWNLVSNAVKFSPGGGGGIWVGLGRAEGQVELTVRDEGPGIPEDFLPHLFERFRQLEGGTTRRYGGLGLGLAIVRHLVELHGGSVRASNGAPGQGATFTVRLPPAPAPSSAPHPALGPARAPTASALAGRQVLVVDDEEDSREMLKLVLEDQGARVTTARSAAEALRVLQDASAARPELLVSDIGMPGEDGYALIGRVRALPQDAGGALLAVALTAYAREDDRLRALSAGFDMHVAKPVEPEELLSVLTTLLSLPPRNAG